MRKLLFSGLILASSLSTEAYAGWVQPPGGYYLKLWDRTLAGQKAFDLDGGQLDLGTKYQDHALNLYGELGLTDELTLVVRATPLGYASIADTSTLYSGLTMIGLKLALLRGGLPLALEVAYGYSPPLDPLATGTGAGATWVFRPSLEQHLAKTELSAGWSLDPVWARAAAGAIFTSGDALDPALEARLAVGLSLPFGLGAQVAMGYHATVRAPRIIDVTGAGNTRYLGLELGASWWFLDDVGVSVGLGTAPFAESNAATASLSFGLELRS